MRSFRVAIMMSFPSKSMGNNTTARLLHICNSYLPGESNSRSLLGAVRGLVVGWWCGVTLPEWYLHVRTVT
jgi:hypothetical protein